ncbi:unnamed protein product [Clavelina lepadiformis]|uniref:Peptidase S9 prolyl oligopeptidase catalytic domain-containing protein n=1 Tax=Clavelina lepadiformis TaxID=159417 RepID=A0ABP0GMW8_CLALP
MVMTFDGRGTGYRGDKDMHLVYKKLGQYEPLDQIEAARQISKFDYIDEQNVAIWGRSYGGYATARTIEEDVNGIYKCGFSVAPVTDWMFYSTHYTEKFMTLPTDNENGYAKASAIQNLDNIRSHYFVLVHGTADENVHIQNNAHLSKALISQNIDFINYFAADEWHGFNHYPNGYAHHYKLLTHHLQTCFSLL